MNRSIDVLEVHAQYLPRSASSWQLAPSSLIPRMSRSVLQPIKTGDTIRDVANEIWADGAVAATQPSYGEAMMLS